MNEPNSIRLLCLKYRTLFATNRLMGNSLGVNAESVCQLLTGGVQPSLDAMITMQAALRESTFR
jgi:hypothetical protein